MESTSRRERDAQVTGASKISRLWTVQDVAQYLRVPVNTIYKWRQAGLGPQGYRVGKHLRFSPEDVDAWLQTCRDEPA